MAHTYAAIYLHFTFSTCQRIKVLSEDIRQRLWPYMAGIARKNGFKALEVGGEADHAHLLASVPPRLAAAKAAQLIKGGSAKWLNETIFRSGRFAWQEGYGVFSVSASVVPAVIEYIRNQSEHHRCLTFEEEFRRLLKKHGIPYDEKFLLG